MKSDRPPVLAHQRFVADRENFANLDLAARFDRILQTNLWGAETSASGLGSEKAAVAAVIEALPGLMRRLGVRTLLDAPCGDVGWIAACIRDVDYTGVDIVPSLIAANLLRAECGDIAGRFLLVDITRDALPRADLILCRDCLVHLSFGNIRSAIARFRESGAQWLLTTTFVDWDANADCEDGDWRDKSLGLWRVADLR